GSQQTGLFDDATVDGVFAMLYAKGPGIDRSGDALKHGNTAGTSRHGGVLVLAGDDHTCKSSTSAHQSEFALIDAMIPVLHPAGAQEFLDFGLHGWAMSRYSGLWAGMKLVSETVDTTTSVLIDPQRPRIVLPDQALLPPEGVHLRWPDSALAKEERLHRYKIDLAQAYARVNMLDRVVIDSPKARLGIVTVGKSYLDVRQALAQLGLDEAGAADLGLRLYKVGMPWPLEPSGLLDFAEGLDEIFVVEEKRGLIEPQIRDLLYDRPDERRPRVVGKKNTTGEVLLPSWDELSPAMIATAIAARLETLGGAGDLVKRARALERRLKAAQQDAGPVARIPHFCSGCPHSSSTRVPHGSQAFAGIGCHYLVQSMDRETLTFTQMGAEGANWIGLSPFRATEHVFVNIGDGTYVHSGLLAIRAAVSAGVNVTYKILYNDAVAMTGGQPFEGSPSVPAISMQLYGEGLRRIAVVSDEPEKYGAGADFAKGVTIHHRSELDAVQRELRTVPGVSALIYDQVCATEKRRRRKRGSMVDPPKRVFINEAVCEGCGDCGIASNCLSVMPVETEYGLKRQIDQSSCNKDMTCIEGFCPSFVTVEGVERRKPEAANLDLLLAQPLAEPDRPGLDQPWSIVIAGVGGTGVVTMAQILGWAAHIDGLGVAVLDQIGLAQKYGGVTSHVRLSREVEGLHASKIGVGEANLLLGCDLVQCASTEVLTRADATRTKAFINDHAAPTGAFTRDPLAVVSPVPLLDRLEHVTVGTFARDMTAWAEILFGNSIAANMMLLGAAYQAGLIPISSTAIDQAIALNGVSIEANRKALAIGRTLVADENAVLKMIRVGRHTQRHQHISASLEEVIERRAEHLRVYQNEALANRYCELIDRVCVAESSLLAGSTALSEAVARNYHKVLAIKDEYEVARLFTDGAFERSLRQTFEDGGKVSLHLAPPLLSRIDPSTGRPKKRAFGPWVWPLLRVLAKGKVLRGTWFDPFSRLEERRRERRLIRDYEGDIGLILERLEPASHGPATALAGIPEEIRGYGPVKMAALDAAGRRRESLIAAMTSPPAQAAAAQ
ncbi:MAG: indolepyruvate ferredoxin oxidoreductase family protein, partial [Rhodospirillaceae bacterium]|nr:indolepyruvate ferredoxin oxidoreductase family protein [Rhodospirillaceae bacterium]